jgi:CheY-like chemotaxis protein
MTRILLVDDDQWVLKALCMGLRRIRREWEIVTAESGADALAELSRGSFDVIVSDMSMPVMNGVELLTRVRDLYPAIRRIALSGSAEQAALDGLASVAHELLEKPCPLKVLAHIIERAAAA